MEIKIGDRTFQVPDSCPTDAPNKRKLRRHVRDHGPESLLTSRKLAPFAPCVLDEMITAGAEAVGAGDEPQVPLDPIPQVPVTEPIEPGAKQ